MFAHYIPLLHRYCFVYKLCILDAPIKFPSETIPNKAQQHHIKMHTCMNSDRRTEIGDAHEKRTLTGLMDRPRLLHNSSKFNPPSTDGVYHSRKTADND